MQKPVLKKKMHPFVEGAIAEIATQARFNNKADRDAFFAEICAYYNITPQMKNGIHPFICVTFACPNKRGESVGQIVCTGGFVRGGEDRKTPVPVYDVNFNRVPCYSEQRKLADQFGLKLGAFVPKSLKG